MNSVRIAINGFGRMGRVFTRVVWNNPAFEIVAINTRSNCDIYAHLLKYDSIYGPWDHEVSHDGNDAIVVDGKKIPMYHSDQVGQAPWGAHQVDVVIESTGAFRDRASSEVHLSAGAKYVVISAPADKEDITMIYGVNHEQFDPGKHRIISAASCTTTCLAPIVQILDRAYGIHHGTVTTTHAYTNDQHLVDYPHRNQSFRRARAATLSMIPTSTGAAKAIGRVIPHLQGKLDGNALRVPIAVPSILSFIAEVKTPTDRDHVNAEFKRAAKEDFPGTVATTNDIGLVSVDFIRSPYGAVIDTLSTLVTDGTQVFAQAWYDNEWGYVTQMANLIQYMGTKI